MACVLRTEPEHKFLYHKFPREGSCLLPLGSAEQRPHISRPALGRAGMGYLGSSAFLLKEKYGEGILVLMGLIAYIWEAMGCVNWKMKSPCKEITDDLPFPLNRVCACAHCGCSSCHEHHAQIMCVFSAVWGTSHPSPWGLQRSLCTHVPGGQARCHALPAGRRGGRSSGSLCKQHRAGVGSALLLLPAQTLRTSPKLTLSCCLAVLCEQGRVVGYMSGAMGPVWAVIPVGWLWALSLCMLLCCRTCDVAPMNSACSHGFSFSGSP